MSKAQIPNTGEKFKSEIQIPNTEVETMSIKIAIR